MNTRFQVDHLLSSYLTFSLAIFSLIKCFKVNVYLARSPPGEVEEEEDEDGEEEEEEEEGEEEEEEEVAKVKVPKMRKRRPFKVN